MLDHLRDHLPLLQYAHLLWGFALFVGLAAWAYWPTRKATMRDHGAMILQDDPQAPLNDSAARGQNVAKH